MPRVPPRESDGRRMVGLAASSHPAWTRLGVAVVAALGCVPIIGQPVQVDDPLFLGVAKQILQTPPNPFGGPPAWHDGDWFSQNANPPLWPYLLAATATVFGWN